MHTFRIRPWTGLLALSALLAVALAVVLLWPTPRSADPGPAAMPSPVPLPGSAHVADVASGPPPSSFPNPINITLRSGSPHNAVAQALEIRYRELIDNSGNPAYSNLLAVLVIHAPDRALSTDLFNDACAYAVSMTMVREWRAEDAAQQRILNRELDGEDSSSDRLTIEEAAVHRSLDARYAPLESFYQAFYAHRFRDRHGIDGEVLADELASIDLPNAGREFTFRCP